MEINAAIREAIELIRTEAATNGVSVQTEFVEALPPIQGDRVELQQVLLNLIINAIEAMSGMSEGRRELFVSTGKTEAGDVLVSVRDTGPGLAPGVQEDLFEAFGLVDLPFDRRAARRALVGERQCAVRRRLSIHIAVHFSQCIVSLKRRQPSPKQADAKDHSWRKSWRKAAGSTGFALPCMAGTADRP